MLCFFLLVLAAADNDTPGQLFLPEGAGSAPVIHRRPWPAGTEAAKAPLQGLHYLLSLRAQLTGHIIRAVIDRRITPLHRNAPEYMVPGVLQHYDIADLIKAIAPRRVEVFNPVEAR